MDKSNTKTFYMETPIRESIDFVSVSYGEKIYKVEADYGVEYHEDCPVCDNTKKIKVRGFEFKCPYCGYPSLDWLNARLLSLSNYKVYEYYVYEFTLSGKVPGFVFDKTDNSPDVTSDMLQRGATIQAVKIIRSVAGEGGKIPDKTLELRSVFWDQSSQDVLCEPEKYYWHDRDAAEHVCALLHEQQRETLRKFNEEHNSDNEYPFKEQK
jgi:hypothetical protein